MFCRNCGNQMDPQAAVCVKCGVPAGSGYSFCPNCGEPSAPGAAICVKCGVSFQQMASQGERKSKVVAGLLGIFLGSIGIHRFYLGYTTIGIIQIIVTVVTCGLGSLWGFIEGIMILCGATITTDAQGRPLSS